METGAHHLRLDTSTLVSLSLPGLVQLFELGFRNWFILLLYEEIINKSNVLLFIIFEAKYFK